MFSCKAEIENHEYRKKVWERFPVVNREVEKELWPPAI
jgi:hypothetical protein